MRHFEFFPFLSYEMPITLSINSLEKLKTFWIFHDSPYLILRKLSYAKNLVFCQVVQAASRLSYSSSVMFAMTLVCHVRYLFVVRR